MEEQRMIDNMDDPRLDQVKRLMKLRSLIIVEIKRSELDDEPDDMTIEELKEWLAEINDELSLLR
jgi:hypothetical protein